MKIYILIIFTALIMLSCGEDTVTPPITNNTLNCGKMPVGIQETVIESINDSIRIVAAMPNPEGEDDYNEYFILKNFGSIPINLSGYVISDDENTNWDLPNIVLNQCDSLKIVSDKTAQLLNSGDKITLSKIIEKVQDMRIAQIFQEVKYVDSESGVEERFDN